MCESVVVYVVYIMDFTASLNILMSCIIVIYYMMKVYRKQIIKNICIDVLVE